MKASTNGKEPSHDEIALRAFLIWEKDGRQPGREMIYWLQAESEVRSSYQKQAAVAAAKAAKPWPPQPAATRTKEVKTTTVAKPAPKAAVKTTTKTAPKAALASKPVTTARLATPVKTTASKPVASRASLTHTVKSAARPARRSA
jgi:hypothetical protein